MKHRVVILSAAVLAVGAVVWSTFGGCKPDTRIGQRSLLQGDAAAPLTAAEDWPRYRGPREDGISRETLGEPKWSADGPTRLWSADVGLGFSSPVAANGRVYLLSLSDDKDALTAFDAHTGAILWNVAETSGFTDSYEGARATPVIEGDRIYTLGGRGDLTCRKTGDGSAIWQTNVLKLAGSTNLQWGVSASPLMDGDRIYVQCGGNGPVAMALDKRDGSVVWKSAAIGTAGYAAPVLVDVAGARQLIIFAGDMLYGMNPADGRTLWSSPWPTNYSVNGSVPIYRDGHLFITSAYGKGCAMFRLSAEGADKLWENRDVQSRFQGTILDGDTLYANSEGTLVAMSWPDGAIRWRSRDVKLGVGGSLVRSGDKLILMTERGTLAVGRATPTGFESLTQADVFDASQVWSTPLLYGGRLYAKGENEFVCFDLGGARPAASPATTQAVAFGAMK
jgi:outer membrane protein assembly factor BamB